MASTYQMTGPLTQADEASIAGVRRSRLSVHLNTPHVRRWLLVQLVSVPVDETVTDGNPGNTRFARAEAPQNKGFGRLIDDYMNTQSLRRCI